MSRCNNRHSVCANISNECSSLGLNSDENICIFSLPCWLNWALDAALRIGNHIRRINGGDVNGERGHTYNHPSLFSMQSLTHPLPISVSAASPSLTPTFPLTTLPSRQPLPKDRQAQHIPSFHISTGGPG